MSKIALIGASGFLGSKLLEILSKTYTVVGTYQNRKQQGLHKLMPAGMTSTTTN